MTSELSSHPPAIYSRTSSPIADQPASALTDDLIIQAMGARPGGIMTYVIRNILAMEHGFRGLRTPAVLTRLKRLERAGRVRRVRSGYAVMLCWAIETHDQFTRWCCEKCGSDGIDSWNKAMFDGVIHEGELPDPWILGGECIRCGWPCVVAYRQPDARPRAIFGPSPVAATGDGAYAYEGDAFERIEHDFGAGVELRPSHGRDCDWSGGCLAARAQLQ